MPLFNSKYSWTGVPSEWGRHVRIAVPFEWGRHVQIVVPLEWGRHVRITVPFEWGRHARIVMPFEWGRQVRIRRAMVEARLRYGREEVSPQLFLLLWKGHLR